MPDSFAGQLKQRRRWQEGLFSLADNLHEILSESPGWELRSRLELLLFEISVVLNVGVSTLCFLAIPLIILSGRVLVLQQSRDQLQFLLRLAVVDMAAQIDTARSLEILADSFDHIRLSRIIRNVAQ